MTAPDFINLPSPQHFAFEYNNQLNGNDAKALGKALADTAERDVATMTGWFSGATPKAVRFDTKINLAVGGEARRVQTIQG
jgi:hypothetical protein